MPRIVDWLQLAEQKGDISLFGIALGLACLQQSSDGMERLKRRMQLLGDRGGYGGRILLRPDWLALCEDC